MARPALAERLGRPATGRSTAREPLIWAIPVAAVVAVTMLSARLLPYVIGIALALYLFAFLVNRPGFALIALIVFLPVETLLFSLLLKWGMPPSILRSASFIKELTALAILVAGLRQIRDTGRRLDRIDIALLVYVGIVTIYLLVPHLFSGAAPSAFGVRATGWRSDAGYPLLFFGARHAPIPPRVKEQFAKVVIAMGGFVSVVALYQRLRPASFSRFILQTVNVPEYWARVLHLPASVITPNLEYFTNLSPLHVSSVFLSPFDMADFLVLVVALVAVRIKSGSRSPVIFAVLAGAVASIFFSQTRADALAAVIILVLIALPISRSPMEGRLRLIGALLLAAVLIVPSLGGTRYLGAQGGVTSTRTHLTDFEKSFVLIQEHPLGFGLGTVPSTVNRFLVPGFVLNGEDVSQDLVVQTAYEIGVPALVAWLAMMTLVLLALRRRGGGGDVFASSMGFGLLGLVIAGLFHHVFVELPIPWTVWGGAGLALSVYRPVATARPVATDRPGP